MLLIKNDPKYNEQWPRAVVPYKRIYGVDEPTTLHAAGERRQAVAAPAGGNAVRPGRHVEPLQARELSRRRRARRQRDGDVRRRARPSRLSRARSVQHVGERRVAQLVQSRAPTPASTPTTTFTPFASWRWSRRPTAITARKAGGCSAATRTNGCASSARFRVRKFGDDGKQPLDPDGNPDTSFLAKIPADTPFTFQTLDKRRHGAEHGADLAPGAARRDPPRLRRLPRAQPEADRLRAHRRREGRLQGLRPDASKTPLLTSKRAATSRAEVGRGERPPACASPSRREERRVSSAT